MWANLPKQKGAETHYPTVTVDVDALLPTVRTSYRYDGSLTTPPCSEGVSWIVMTTPIELGRAAGGIYASHQRQQPAGAEAERTNDSDGCCLHWTRGEGRRQQDQRSAAHVVQGFSPASSRRRRPEGLHYLRQRKRRPV